MASTRLIFLSVICVFAVGQSNAQHDTRSVADEIEQFRAAYPTAIVDRDDSLSRLRFITGIRKSGTEGFPDEVAISALVELASLFGFSGAQSQFEVVDEKSSPAGGIRYMIDATTRTDPENHSFFLVGVTRRPQGSYHYVTSDGMVAPPGFVFVSTSDDTSIYESRDDWYIYFISRILDRPADSMLATVEEFSHPNAGIEFHTSAASFITKAASRQQSDCQSNSFLSTGTGNVYYMNPLRADPEEVSFDNLCDDTPTTLNGKYVHVSSEVFPSVQNDQGEFHFEPDTPDFDQVNVYYHVNKFVELMLERGFSKEVEDGWRVEAILNASEAETIGFDKFDGKILAGDAAPPYRNSVYESAILAHEVTHHLMYDYIGTSFFSIGEKEHWALGESYADYFGLVYRAFQFGDMQPWRNAVIGEYFVSETTRDLPRDIASDEPTFSGLNRVNYVGFDTGDDILNLYDNSVIFSTALMDYDRFDGSEHSSSFVIESLLNLNESPSFETAKNALIAATNECAMVPAPGIEVCCEFENCYQPVINAFALRGMPTPNIAVEVTRPLPLTPVASTGTYPNPFDVKTTIQFEMNRAADVSVRIYNAEGRLVDELISEHRPQGQHSLDWQPNQLPSGAYFFEIYAEGSSSRGSLLFVK